MPCGTVKRGRLLPLWPPLLLLPMLFHHTGEGVYGRGLAQANRGSEAPWSPLGLTVTHPLLASGRLGDPTPRRSALGVTASVVSVVVR
jgi:hypothetical protein